MKVTYTDTPVNKVEIKLEQDFLKMGFLSENKELFMQVITSYTHDGFDNGQAGCTMNKLELKRYINILEEIYSQM